MVALRLMSGCSAPGTSATRFSPGRVSLATPMIMAMTSAHERGQLGAAEEEGHLDLRRLRRVRPVHRVALDALAEDGADGPRRRLAGIGRPHDLPVLRDGPLALEYL